MAVTSFSLELHAQEEPRQGRRDLLLSETTIPRHQNPENQRPPSPGAHIYVY